MLGTVGTYAYNPDKARQLLKELRLVGGYDVLVVGDSLMAQSADVVAASVVGVAVPLSAWASRRVGGAMGGGYRSLRTAERARLGVSSVRVTTR